MICQDKIYMILGAINTEKRFENSRFNLFLNDTLNNSGWRDEIKSTNLEKNNQLIMDFNNMQDVSRLNNKVDYIVFDWSVVKFFKPIRPVNEINNFSIKKFKIFYDLLKSNGKFLIPIPTINSYYYINELFGEIKKNSNLCTDTWRLKQFRSTIEKLCKDLDCYTSYKEKNYCEEIIKDNSMELINYYVEITKK